MNMKKTIAALAAGAVAVSAMATTVSALADTSLTYNLVKDVKVNKFDDHKATFEYTINAIPAGSTTTTTEITGYAATEAFTGTDTAQTQYTKGQEITVEAYEALPEADKAKFEAVKEPVETEIEGAGYPTTVQLVNPGKVESIVIKVASSTAGEQNKIFTYSSNNEALNYNANLNKDTGVFEFDKELAQYTGQLTITITTNVAIDGTREDLDEIKEINGQLGTGIKVIADLGDVTPVKLNAFTKGGKVEKVYYAPFKTAITDNQNITAYLQNEKGYHNVGAVLNDAIENYESVTFTFNTATNPIAYGVKAGTYKIPASQYNDWAEETRTFAVDCEKVFSANSDWWADGTYAMALDAVGGDTSRLIGIYAGEAWAGDSSFLTKSKRVKTHKHKVLC